MSSLDAVYADAELWAGSGKDSKCSGLKGDSPLEHISDIRRQEHLVESSEALRSSFRDQDDKNSHCMHCGTGCRKRLSPAARTS